MMNKWMRTDGLDASVDMWLMVKSKGVNIELPGTRV